MVVGQVLSPVPLCSQQLRASCKATPAVMPVGFSGPDTEYFMNIDITGYPTTHQFFGSLLLLIQLACYVDCSWLANSDPDITLVPPDTCASALFTSMLVCWCKFDRDSQFCFCCPCKVSNRSEVVNQATHKRCSAAWAGLHTWGCGHLVTSPDTLQLRSRVL